MTKDPPILSEDQISQARYFGCFINIYIYILAIDNIISYHIISYYSFQWRKVESDFFICRALFMLVTPSGSAKAKDLLPVVAVGLGDPGVIHGSVF